MLPRMSTQMEHEHQIVPCFQTVEKSITLELIQAAEDRELVLPPLFPENEWQYSSPLKRAIDHQTVRETVREGMVLAPTQEDKCPKQSF